MRIFRWFTGLSLLLAALSLASAQMVVPNRISVTSSGGETEDPAASYVTLSSDGNYAAFSSQATNLINGKLISRQQIYRKNMSTGLIELVSVKSNGQIANDSSWNTFISADGTYVVFTSWAGNLDPNIQPPVKPAVYLRDMKSGVTACVSVKDGHLGINGESDMASVSADGNLVLFQSTATNAVTGDTKGFSDIFVYNRTARTTKRISVGLGGTEANGGSYNGQISANGKFAVFQSDATNLVSGDTNSNTDVFLANLGTGAVERVSVPNVGVQGDYGSFDPSISADGLVISFTSDATQLDGKTQGSCIFIRDCIAKTTKLISKYAGGGYANRCGQSCVSSTGRYVSFQSSNPIDVADDNNDLDVYVYDRSAPKMTLASIATDGSRGARRSNPGRGNISKDGALVAFSSLSPEFDRTKRNYSFACYVRDVPRKSTKRISGSPSGTDIGAGGSYAPSASGDGRFIVYTSSGTNQLFSETSDPLTRDQNNAEDVFLYDRQTKKTTILSVNIYGYPSYYNYVNASGQPDISGDGKTIVFTSLSNSIVPNHSNKYSDIFLRKDGSPTVTWISGSSSNLPNGSSYNPRVSADGKFVVFTSQSTSILPGVPLKTSQIYRYNVLEGTTICVSLNNAGAFSNQQCDLAAQSSDGRYVVFESTATNLGATNPNKLVHIFVRDTKLNTTVVASITSDRSAPATDCLRPWITDDGNRVVFDSAAGNLVVGDTNKVPDVFLRDIAAGTTTRVSVSQTGLQGNDWSTSPYISGDGRYLTFGSWSKNLTVPVGLTHAYHAFRKSLSSGEVVRLTMNSVGAEGDSDTPMQVFRLTKDGQTATFATRCTNLVSNDQNLALDVFQVQVKPPITLNKLVLSPTTLQSTETSTLTVTLSDVAPTGGIKVILASNNGVVSLPAFVMVPAGSQTGTATVTVGKASASITVGISAGLGAGSLSANLVVRPWLKSISLSPTSVTAGGTSIATLALNAPVPAGKTLTISLKSGDPSIATLPATIVIVGGASSGQFTITSKSVAATKTVQIVATVYDHSVSGTLTVKKL